MDSKAFIITGVGSMHRVTDARGKRVEFKHRYAACFIVTLRGRIRFTSSEGTVVADKDHPVFLPEGLSYVNECEQEAESLVLNFHTSKPYRAPESLSPIPERVAREHFSAMETAARASENGTLAILGHLYALAAHLFSPPAIPAEGESIVYAARAYMMEHYSDPSLSIGQIADACHVSEVYLRKLFVKHQSMPPFKALTNIRMERAHALTMEKRPIGEIAASVGYSDIYQFSRAYRRHFAHPPSGHPRTREASADAEGRF